MQCLTPPLSKKPAGEWLCPECKEEADLEARAAAEREAKSRKCCACGARGEEASVHALLASAWAGAVLELGPAPVGKFALCEKCAHRHEAVWRHGIVRVHGHVRLVCVRNPLSVGSRVRLALFALFALRRSPPGRHGRIQALLHLPWRQRRARCCGRQGHQGQWGREWDQNHSVLFMSSRHLLYLSVAQRGQVAAATFSGQRSRGRCGRGGGGGRRLAVPGL